MHKITPLLWFDGKAEEAMNFYVSVFKNSKVGRVTRCGEAGPGEKGTVMSATSSWMGKNSTHLTAVRHSASRRPFACFVNCETQQEGDELWEKLSADGEKSRGGWLKDKYGLSWQIIPSVSGKMLQDKDAGKAERIMNTMLQMGEIETNRLQEAYEQA